jgi:hypothetical protein
MSKFPVTEAAMRLASSRRDCFYCDEPVGGHHKDDCVLLRRKTRVAFTVELDLDEVADWGDDMIASHYTSGSWCGSNLVQMLENLLEERHCLCGLVKAEVVSREDEITCKER